MVFNGLFNGFEWSFQWFQWFFQVFFQFPKTPSAAEPVNAPSRSHASRRPRCLEAVAIDRGREASTSAGEEGLESSLDLMFFCLQSLDSDGAFYIVFLKFFLFERISYFVEFSSVSYVLRAAWR